MRDTSTVVFKDVPGAMVVATSAVGSRNGGRKFPPILVATEPADTSSTAVIISRSRGWESANFNQVVRKAVLRTRTGQTSRSLPGLGFRRKELSTGMTVRETTKETAMLTMVAMAIGENRRPSTPLNARSGKNTRMINTVAKKMEDRTSPEARAITSIFGSGSSAEAFSRRRRKTFSTSTMASSTTIPIATARPPRVMEFTDMSSRSKIRIVMPRDKGMAVRVITVTRKLKRKRKRMIDTMMAPSRRASVRLPMDRSMKSRWR